MKTPAAIALVASALLTGCHLPGRPAAGDTPQRPDQVNDFHALYSNNCAGCHGAEGKGGAAIALASPVYLAYAGESNIQRLIAEGVPSSPGVASPMMPGFGKKAGGMLTDAQIQILAHGMVTSWGNPAPAQAKTLPPFASQTAGDSNRGETAYGQLCLRCHAAGQGSITDPTYLALITDEGLRSFIVAGKPAQGMPDWSGYGGSALTDTQVSDLVAYLAAKRSTATGDANSKPNAEPSQAPAGQTAAGKASKR